MSRTLIQCHHCKGAGTTVLSSLYELTLKELRKSGRSTGAGLARRMECKATAMNNRLRRLEQLGLAKSEWDGRERWYEA